MASKVEISIPSTAPSNTSKVYTIYNITLRLPLRSYSIQKRYSDFVTLDQVLTEQVGAKAPATIPPKSWSLFSSTSSSPELTETRRKGLEQYLQTINNSEDNRWRNTAIWRAFLNLPASSTFNSSSETSRAWSSLPGRDKNTPITDPTLWLDTHRDLKQQLHDARLNLTTRDQASTPQKQHEASAAAKSCLVVAGTLLTALEAGLAEVQKSTSPKSEQIGAGELRRRKDLLAAARKDRDALENLHAVMATKKKIDSAVASVAEHTSLLSGSNSLANGEVNQPNSSSRLGRGRVLGKETNETRALDNAGVLQLQKQKMVEQDLDVDEIRKIVMRQRELGVAINQELEVQNDMLRMVDEDVDRLQGKINIAKKRVDKIK